MSDKCCQIDFTIEENNLNFGLDEKDSFSFNADLGYIKSDVSDYTLLSNKPKINNVVLLGNKLSEELGLEPTIIDITEQDIDNIIFS